MEDLTGKQFGHYQIVAPLGEGGMAAVYKAYQPSMERYVAIKVLPRHMASSEEFLNRFRREARLLAKLQHQNILPVFDYGESDGYPYIVMPFVPSGTLAELINGKQLPLPKVRRIMTQLGDALAYAHARGMIHRDIKPSNVLIDESGNCLLTDFGLARMVESSSKLTSSGTVLGTPAYMSPEQGAGSEIDHRSDIYSLGIILYEAVTGRVPYNAETPIAIVFKHIQDPLPSARKFNPELPEAVELILLKALAKKPEDRYQTMEGFLQAIQAATSDTLPGNSSPSTKAADGFSTRKVTEREQEGKEEVPELKPKRNGKGKSGGSGQSTVLSEREVPHLERVRKSRKKVYLTVSILGGILLILGLIIGLAKSRGILVTNLSIITTSNKISNLKTTSENSVNPITTFSKDQNVFIRFDLNTVKANTLFETKWYYRVNILRKDVYFLITTLANTATPGDNRMFFYLTAPGVKGIYQVDIYMDDILVGRRVFSVE